MMFSKYSGLNMVGKFLASAQPKFTKVQSSSSNCNRYKPNRLTFESQSTLTSLPFSSQTTCEATSAFSNAFCKSSLNSVK